MRPRYFLFGAWAWFSAVLCYATIFGTVRGIVHDPQHRPIAGAQVTLQARASGWMKTTETNRDGEFQFDAVPVGEYVLTATQPGFSALEQTIVVQSASAPVLHLPMKLAEVTQTVRVSASPELINRESSTTESVISQSQIERAPGADRTNSLAMITDFVPGTYIVHDQLHVRGGHQASWLVDGVPVPNTNIAGNVGPQFDPKDVDYVEVQRGGYSAEYGDRTFGVFNIVPRSGFERDNEAQLLTSFGSFHETNDQFSLGGHSQRFAYYLSLNGNRTDLGLETPTTEVLHDLGSGLGGFASLIYNATPADQLRLVVSLRRDHYHVPNTRQQEALGLRDVQKERDAFVNFSWVHTLGRGTLLTVSPFYHYNRAAFQGGRGDTPVIPTDNRRSSYAGGQISLSVVTRKHNARVGIYGFAQSDDSLFALQATDGSELSLQQPQKAGGNLEAFYLEDQYKITSWLTLNAGVRLTHFSGLLAENAASPRLGAAIQVPRLNWVVRGFYGRYYQAPPLSTISGPLLELALEQGFSFLPLRGERDEQREIGLMIPLFGWVIDLDYFHTNARNYFDHDVLGNSNIFFPLTIAGARLRGWEATVRSPLLFRRARFHLAYSHQFAEGQGGVTGGLTDFSPPTVGMFFLDHDQRDTLSTGFEVDLPWQSWVAGNFAYGSGFLNGDGPAHLPSHRTFDLSLGKAFGEKISVRLSALNLTNRRFLLDNSNTFGGTHYNYPRQLSVTLHYRFHY